VIPAWLTRPRCHSVGTELYRRTAKRDAQGGRLARESVGSSPSWDLNTPTAGRNVTNRPVGSGRPGSCYTSWVRPKGHLLPFCSHTSLKQAQALDTRKHDARSHHCSSFPMFVARSEGCRQSPETTHNPKVAGSNPAPATMENEGLVDAAAANPFRLPRLHPGIGHVAPKSADSECSLACTGDSLRYIKGLNIPRDRR
jgi:hypothetical protein